MPVLLLSSEHLEFPLEVDFFFFPCPFHLHGFVGEVRESEEVLASQDSLEFWSEPLQKAGHLHKVTGAADGWGQGAGAGARCWAAS